MESPSNGVNKAPTPPNLWVKNGVLHQAQGSGLWARLDAGSLIMHTPMALLGRHRAMRQDPASEVGKAQSGVPVEHAGVDWGPQACMESEDHRFSGSRTFQTPLFALGELRMEQAGPGVDSGLGPKAKEQEESSSWLPSDESARHVLVGS